MKHVIMLRWGLFDGLSLGVFLAVDQSRPRMMSPAVAHAPGVTLHFIQFIL